MAEPITIAIVAVLAALGATKVVRLTFSAIRDWMAARKVPQGTGQIVGDMLAHGDYTVVANVFNPQGTRIGRQKWRARELDDELAGELKRNNGKIVVRF